MTMSVARMTSFTFLFLLNINIFACPDFSSDGSGLGRFECTNPGGSESHQLQIERVSSDTGNFYIWSAENKEYHLIPDGVERYFSNDTINLTYIASCLDDKLQMDIQGDLYENDPSQGRMVYRALISLDENDNLKQNFIGKTIVAGKETPFELNINCIRIY